MDIISEFIIDDNYEIMEKIKSTLIDLRKITVGKNIL